MFEVVYLQRELENNDIYGMRETIEHAFFISDAEFHQWLADCSTCGIEITIKAINENTTINRLKRLRSIKIISHYEMVEYMGLLIWGVQFVRQNKTPDIEHQLKDIGIL